MRAVWVVAIVGTVVAALAWAEGVRRTPGEREALDGCASAATIAVAGTEVRLSAISSYIAPALGVGTDQLDSGLRRLVSDQARRARRGVVRALRVCRDVEVWILNAEHRQARAAYVSLLEAQQRHLGTVITDGRPYGPTYDEVVSRREEAEALWPSVIGEQPGP